MVCEEIAQTEEGDSLIEQGAISNNGTSLGHYRRPQWDGEAPPDSVLPPGCCCVIDSIELVNVQSFWGTPRPRPEGGASGPEGGTRGPDRWGHKFGIKIKYWYKIDQSRQNCELKWQEWSDNFALWTKFDKQNPIWRDISKQFPASPVFDAWKQRPVTPCYGQKPANLTEVILPVELAVAWDGIVNESGFYGRDLWIHLTATGCDLSNASLCIHQHLEIQPETGRSGWIGAKTDCDVGVNNQPSTAKPTDAVDYVG